jgi:hypothetical protein
MNLLSRAIALGLVISIRLCAEYGCMDTSYHLAQLNDPKTYHHVTGADGGPCSCPCSKYCAQYRCSLARGQCPVCMHYRVPRPFIITKGTKESQELRTAKAIDQYKFPFMRTHREKTGQQPHP